MIRHLCSNLLLPKGYLHGIPKPTTVFPARSMASESAAYDGDGKTTVTVLGRDGGDLNMISSYSPQGFRLHNGLLVKGSMILFPTHIYSWDVHRAKEINPDSLLVFDLIVPKLKIVVIGYGQRNEEYDHRVVTHFRDRGISCEILPTPQAASTYNYLVNDAVHVAGAFVPILDTIPMTHEDAFALHGNSNISNDDGMTLPMDYEREPREYVRQRFQDMERIGREKSKPHTK